MLFQGIAVGHARDIVARCAPQAFTLYARPGFAAHGIRVIYVVHKQCLHQVDGFLVGRVHVGMPVDILEEKLAQG